MPDHDFRTVVDALCARLQADLHTQAAELATRHAAEREAVAREAESHWAVRLDAVREEWNGRLQAGLADAAAETERRLAAEAERARLEIEALRTASAETAERHKRELEAVREEWQGRMQAGIADVTADADRRVIAETDRIRHEVEEAAAARLREEMDRALAAERERGDVDLQGERSRVHALLAERDNAASDLEAERLRTQTLTLALEEAQAASRENGKAAQAVVEARAAERQAQLAAVERLLASVRAIGSAGSLSDTLNALADAAGAIAPRAALFVAHPAAEAGTGALLLGWKAVGFGDDALAKLRISTTDDAAAGCLGAAVTEGRAVPTTSSPAPAFAALAVERAGLAVPITVGGASVAVLYADDAPVENPEAPASWPEALQVLVAHASACLAHITAARTAQAVQQMSPRVTRPTVTGTATAMASPEEDSSARRYARLLVSEIKLYNEAAVRTGREKRDILNRLGPEIERARRLYEERVSPAIGARASYFQQELVHTLADGDAALLGSAQ